MMSCIETIENLVYLLIYSIVALMVTNHKHRANSYYIIFYEGTYINQGWTLNFFVFYQYLCMLMYKI